MKLIVQENGVLIPQDTIEGFILCPFGGAVNLAYLAQNKRRGRVQGEGYICPTLTTSPTVYIIEKDES